MKKRFLISILSVGIFANCAEVSKSTQTLSEIQAATKNSGGPETELDVTVPTETVSTQDVLEDGARDLVAILDDQGVSQETITEIVTEDLVQQVSDELNSVVQEEEQVVEETPVVVEEPVQEETPVVVEEPVQEETPVVVEEPVQEETPVVVEVPQEEVDLIEQIVEEVVEEQQANNEINNTDQSLVREPFVPEPVDPIVISKKAKNYSDKRGKWWKSRSTMYTYYEKQELYYKFKDLPAGNYKVVLTVKHFDWLWYKLPKNYSKFNFIVGNAANQQQFSMKVDASYDYKSGISESTIEHSGGNLEIYVYWTNDYFDRWGGEDANLQIKTVKIIQQL